MKIIYLTWGETPRMSGVYGSQVIGQLKSIQEAMPNAEITLVSGVPIIFSGLVKEKWGYFEELDKIKKSLGNIKLKIIPIFAPQNFFYGGVVSFKFFHFFSSQLFLSAIKPFNPDIVHCRSYHASYVAITTRELNDLKYKVIFDARGLWVEECVFKNKIRANSRSYLYLKKIENNLLKKSDITIAVSTPMEHYYRDIGVGNYEKIYISANFKELSDKASNKHGINTSSSEKKTATVFCYIGALRNDSWHTPKNLFDVYAYCRKIVLCPELLIISQSNHNLILREIENIPLNEIKIVSVKTPKELAQHLYRSNIGIIPYCSSPSKINSIVGKTILGTKTCEYLSSGLPVLVNKHCRGAGELVEKFGVGLMYDPINYNEINTTSINSLLSTEISNKCMNVAEDLFSYKANALRYKKIITDLYQS